MHKPLRIIACVFSMLVLAGCVTHEPMPQTVYGGQYQTLFMDIPDSLKSSKVDVLYVTDRALDEERGILLYGSDRSFSLAFGVARVNLGKDLSWDDLVAWTMTQGATESDIEPEVESVTEITRLPPSPYRYVLDQNSQPVLDPAIASKRQAVQKQIQEIVSSRLGLSERKQIHIHIHGIRDQFGETLIRLAMSHHVYGRQGVPILYSWPAGALGRTACTQRGRAFRNKLSS